MGKEFVFFGGLLFVACELDAFVIREFLLGKEFAAGFGTSERFDESGLQEVILPVLNVVEAVASLLVEVDAEIIDRFIVALFFLENFHHCLGGVGDFEDLSFDCGDEEVGVLSFDVGHLDAVEPSFGGHGESGT